jgi:hypothetical protein
MLKEKQVCLFPICALRWEINGFEKGKGKIVIIALLVLGKVHQVVTHIVPLLA